MIRKLAHVIQMCVQFTPSKLFVTPIKVIKLQVVLILHKKCTCFKLPDTEGNLRQHFFRNLQKIWLRLIEKQKYTTVCGLKNSTIGVF